MEGIADRISSQVAILSAAVQRLRSAEPSFENGIPIALVSDPEAAAARQEVLSLTDELHALLSDPAQLLAGQTNPAISTNAICQTGLIKTLPIGDKGRNIGDMAKEAGLPEDLAKRFMKHATTHRVFSEISPGVYTHTAASKLLAQDLDCQKWLQSATTEVVPASYKISEAVKKWNSSGEPNHAGWNIVHGSDVSVFEELDKSPERAENFAASMRFFSKHPGFDFAHLFDAFDWKSLSGKVLTDVGGSSGHASIYLADKVPGLNCVVQDRALTIEQARHSLPSHLGERVKFEVHEFFEDQVRTSDCFLLRLILHDWSEKYAIKILRALIPGMKPGTKVLVQDMVLAGFGSGMSAYHQRIQRGFDLNMLGLQNGQERDLDDWEKLFGRADSRFHLTRVHQSPASIFGLLEYTWVVD